jgi:GlpG protein
MRLIGSLKKEEETSKLSHLFNRDGIEHSYEFRPASSQEDGRFDIWIVNEDDFEKAIKLFDQLKKNPDAKELNLPSDLEKEEKQAPSLFDTPPISPKGLSSKERRGRLNRLTFLFLAISIILFIVNQLQKGQIFRSEQGKTGGMLIITPLMHWTLYDFPPIFETIVKFQEQFGTSPFAEHKTTTQEQEGLKQQIAEGKYFEGYYPVIQARLKGDFTTPFSYPHFYKISKGQLWRFFSPIFMHAGFLHLLFNMLWLLVLGAPIEQRLGSKKLLYLTLIAAFFSNTAQYLISGPLFLGFSGVIVAYAGYVYSRKRVAPWEGYPVQRSVLLFIFIYVLALFVLQFGAFAYDLIDPEATRSKSIAIANTAHIVGGLVGIFCGRLKTFAWKPRT